MRARTLSSILALSLGLTLPAMAAPLRVDVEDAADHQVSAQGSYQGGLSQSWEWRFGSKRSADNITGITAHGLIAAHKLTGLAEHEASALRAARSLIKAYDGGWKQRRPRTQDIEFLAVAGFVIDAGRWFSVITQRYGAKGYVDHVIDARAGGQFASLAGWDIASAIRAAVAVGQPGTAQAMLSRLVERRPRWDLKDNANAQKLSAGSLLWAISEVRRFRPLTAEQHAFTDSLVQRLLSAQTARGSWATGDDREICTQTTAYAVLGLNAIKRGQRATQRGRQWLRRAALSDKLFFVGGRMWPSRYGLDGQPGAAFHGAVQSEVMMALATAPLVTRTSLANP
ncbi:MAG: hypothetical protein JRH20_19440 [Deltaproteobacteria bacterium]|nr:hypothetical protein [Deltaproteobacteria bacterium]